MTAARRGTARVVHLVGEPGIGKTTLAERAAALASEQGWVAAWGRAWDAGAAPPYWLWQQVLGSLARTTNLSGRVHPATAAWLADLVPELAGAGEVPPAPALDPAGARRGGLAAPGKRRQPVLRRPTGALVGHARAGRAARRAAGERGGASGGRRAAGRAWWRGPPGGDGGGGGRRRGRPRGPCHRGWAAAGPLRRRGHRRGRRRRAAGAAPGDRGRAGGAARPARAAG